MDKSITPNLNITGPQFSEAVDEIMEREDDEYETLDGKIMPNVKKFTRGMREAVRNNYSQVIILSSMKKNGMGKSSLLGHMGMAISKKFSFDRNFFFAGNLDDIKKKTNELPTGDILCMDEIARLWYKRRAMTSKVIDLNEWMMADQRKTQVIFAGAVPDFWDLDRYAIQGKVDYYVECLARGVGIAFQSDTFPHTDPWHENIFESLQRRRSKFAHKDTLWNKIKILKKHPCYKQLVFWSKLKSSDQAIYNDLVKKSVQTTLPEDNKMSEIEIFKQDFLKKEAGEKYTARKAIMNLVEMLKLRGVKKRMILETAGLSESKLNTWRKSINKAENKLTEKIVKQEVKIV